MSRILKEGPGWRLGWDPQATDFPALVGGSDWALELRAGEFADLRRLALQLAETMAAMADELMAEERLCCEAESEQLWLEVEGFPQAYALRLILQQGRRAELSWSPEATAALLQAIAALESF
jgi:hypothetical protein